MTISLQSKLYSLFVAHNEPGIVLTIYRFWSRLAQVTRRSKYWTHFLGFTDILKTLET